VEASPARDLFIIQSHRNVRRENLEAIRADWTQAFEAAGRLAPILVFLDDGMAIKSIMKADSDTAVLSAE
jgi:hypothetical protein